VQGDELRQPQKPNLKRFYTSLHSDACGKATFSADGMCFSLNARARGCESEQVNAWADERVSGCRRDGKHGAKNCVCVCVCVCRTECACLFACAVFVRTSHPLNCPSFTSVSFPRLGSMFATGSVDTKVQLVDMTQVKQSSGARPAVRTLQDHSRVGVCLYLGVGVLRTTLFYLYRSLCLCVSLSLCVSRCN
jgi:hypothetical protein